MEVTEEIQTEPVATDHGHKTNVRHVVRGSTLRVAGLVANTCIAFFMMPFVVHHLGDRIYGYWVLVGSVLGYYGILDFGIVSAVQYFVAKALGERDSSLVNRTIATSFFTFAGIGFLTLGVTGVLAFAAAMFTNDPAQIRLLRFVLLIMGAGFAIGFPGRALLGALAAHLRMDLVSLVGLVTLVLRAGLIVISIEAGYGIIGLACATVFTDLLTYISFYFMLRKIQHPFVLSIVLADLSTLKQILQYGIFTFIVKFSDQLRFYVDALVVSALVGVTAVTHYSVASRLALSLMEFMIALVGLLSAWFSLLAGKRDYQRIRKLFGFGTKVSVAVATAIVVPIILNGNGFISLWMGKTYADAYVPLCLLVTGIFFDVAQQTSVCYLFGVSLNRFLAQITLVEGIVNVILSVFLARRYGLSGVAAGTLIPMFLFKFCVQPVYVCRQIGIEVKSYYLEMFGRTTVITALAGIVLWMLLFRHVPQTNLAEASFLIAVQMALALACGFVFIFNSEERAMLIASFFHAFDVRRAAVSPAQS